MQLTEYQQDFIHRIKVSIDSGKNPLIVVNKTAYTTIISHLVRQFNCNVWIVFDSLDKELFCNLFINFDLLDIKYQVDDKIVQINKSDKTTPDVIIFESSGYNDYHDQLMKFYQNAKRIIISDKDFRSNGVYDEVVH